MALLSSTTGSLTGAMTGPILNWDPVPGLKYDKKRTDEGIKLNQFKTLTGQLLSTCTQKNGGGLLKDGTMKKKRMLVSYPRSGSTWMLATIMNIFGIISDREDKNSIIPKDCGCTLTTRTHDFSVMRQKKIIQKVKRWTNMMEMLYYWFAIHSEPSYLIGLFWNTSKIDRLGTFCRIWYHPLGKVSYRLDSGLEAWRHFLSWKNDHWFRIGNEASGNRNGNTVGPKAIWMCC